MSATPRRWIDCCASVGTRPISAEIHEELRAAVRAGFKRTLKPLPWAAGFAVVGILTIALGSRISDTVLLVFVLSEGIAAVFVGVFLHLLCEASRLQQERKLILRQPFVERFETPPEFVGWIEREQAGDDSCDLWVGFVEVFVVDGTMVGDEFRAGRSRERRRVWEGVLPWRLDPARTP